MAVTEGLYRRRSWWISALLAGAVGLALMAAPQREDGTGLAHAAVPEPNSPVTFHHDIAPIVYKHCASCHHAGQPAPFDLLSFRDVQKRARQIVEVTQSGYMPPWLPEPGYGEFLNVRRLSTPEKELLQRWLSQGCVEGDPKDGPPQPQWPGGWTLGQPDLVVTMEKPYTLGPDGPDVYRNFIVPVPLDRDRFVRAVEFAPGNPRIVHHAFIKLDANQACRRLERHEADPGFPGMYLPAEMPDGQFLTWQPGKLVAPMPEGLAWRLPKGSDLILQEHLNRSGKPELLRSSIGLYFTDRAPTNTCFKMALFSLALDFPAGASNCVVRDAMVLPVDVDVLAVLPHAHYLAKEMNGYAMLPDGTRRWLLRIRQWDFRWQGDYRYAQPEHLPRGTTLHLEFTYDNSTNNINNPNHPPQRIRYGPQSSDEMCELWFQLLPANSTDLTRLKEAAQSHNRQLFFNAAQHRIEVDPQDAAAHLELSELLWDSGQHDQAWQHIDRALQLQPDSAAAHLTKGTFLRFSNRPTEARRELEIAQRLSPDNPRVYGHLGFVQASLGQAQAAEECFLKALALDPNDRVIQEGLRELRQWRQSHRP